ncbi:MAG TPA: SprT family zinc-dependent metalloprotease [Pseudonocardia sp.]|jgi:predicted metal-dependent hydrolase|nr:SprT family zinc-dependent metalloprotease [Pseudonocardia sp.]
MNTGVVGTRELLVHGRSVVVQVRESRRARTVRLVVAPGRPPELVVPVRTRRRVVDEFLSAHHGWLADRLAALDALERQRVLPRLPGAVCVAGEPVPVVHDPAGRSRAVLDGGRLTVGGTLSDVHTAVDRWYRNEARRRLTEAVGRHAPGLDVQVTAISVRDQRTRWGSCSRTGRLSFSWRLVLAPPPVLTYVVQHELCHLREFNHSKAFWRLVASIRPDWREPAGWLREHGHELHAYRPELTVSPAGRLPSVPPIRD